MQITSVEFQEDGSYLVNKNADANSDGQFSVPDDMANRHRRKLQEWIDAGNTPTPYVAPVKTWLENRQENYPSIEELVVALYDTDDKAALEKRRSDVKKRFPKT
jgi:hypothetical protein|tara:strand:- start:400 stop:711 length:312 start_codon:yes stop_codon:yes gene_type:complete